MALQNAPLQVNKFIRGLVTEVNPLEFPPDASVDEKNLVLDKTGLRRRRFGINFESSFVTNTPTYGGNTDTVTTKTFKWEDVGGDSSKEFLAVQINSSLLIYNALKEPLSSNLIITFDLKTDHVCQMASVDGKLVIANNLEYITIFSYDRYTESFSRQESTLKVRDLFGVEDIFSRSTDVVISPILDPLNPQYETEFVDLLEKQYIDTRPTELTDSHLYNLRNQGWNRVVPPFNGDTGDALFGVSGSGTGGALLSTDPLRAFNEYVKGGFWPSNADVIAPALIDDTEETPPFQKFRPLELGAGSKKNVPAPKGSFIIDALKRGVSREQAERDNWLNTDYRTYNVTASPSFDLKLSGPLRRDETPDGATCISQFAGRVFYAGFSSEVIFPDKHSPRLSSYVFFSQSVRNLLDITKCYQEADPTDPEDSDLVDTDGGFIKLDEAYNIKALANIGDSLIVLADNGIWSIRGGDNQYFSATNYEVDKISDRGCVSAESLVIIDNSLMYWSEDGIYLVGRNELGDLKSQNLTETSIQRFFENIPYPVLKTVRGSYDRYDKTVRWLYCSRELGSPACELIYNTTVGAFSRSETTVIDSNTPVILDYVLVPPFRLGSLSEEVVVGGVQVTADGENVTVSEEVDVPGTRETKFLTLTGVNPITVTFSQCRDTDFLDWKGYDGVGVDAPAYAVSGYITGGDNMRRKQAPFLFVYLGKTEDGFTETNEELYPNNESSCKVQAQWNWHTSAAGNKWATPFEAYRLSKFYLPENSNDGFDTGDSLVITRNKLRGNGKALSLKFSTSPGKDLRLYGWGLVLSLSKNI